MAHEGMKTCYISAYFVGPAASGIAALIEPPSRFNLHHHLRNGRGTFFITYRTYPYRRLDTIDRSRKRFYLAY